MTKSFIDRCCMVGNMLNVDGDADAFVEARIQIGWNKFKHLVCTMVYQYGYIIDYERETVQQLCAK